MRWTPLKRLRRLRIALRKHSKALTYIGLILSHGLKKENGGVHLAQYLRVIRHWRMCLRRTARPQTVCLHIVSLRNPRPPEDLKDLSVDLASSSLGLVGEHWTGSDDSTEPENWLVGFICLVLTFLSNDFSSWRKRGQLIKASGKWQVTSALTTEGHDMNHNQRAFDRKVTGGTHV